MLSLPLLSPDESFLLHRYIFHYNSYFGADLESSCELYLVHVVHYNLFSTVT